MGYKGQHNMQIPTWIFERAQKITGLRMPTNFLRDVLSEAILQYEIPEEAVLELEPEPEPEEPKLTGLEINGEKIETEDQLLVALTKIANVVEQARKI